MKKNAISYHKNDVIALVGLDVLDQARKILGFQDFGFLSPLMSPVVTHFIYSVYGQVKWLVRFKS